MSQRNSEYERQERDLYETPEWVTEALIPYIPLRIKRIWEPAAGNGAMVRPIARAKYTVIGTDIAMDRNDFLMTTRMKWCARGIVTNPPYELATEFCHLALALTEEVNGFVAMLLRTDFDHAKSRTHLFRDCPAFAKKLVLMKRIVWFADENGKPKASPSYNHCWMIWDHQHEGPPTIAYGP